MRAVSGAAKLGYGVLLPAILFIVYQIVLIGSMNSTGGWEGMGIAFGSLVIVPALLIANCWVLFVAWMRRTAVMLAGIALPAVIGTAEYFLLHGPSWIRWAINAAFVAPFTWLWLFAMRLFAPLAFLFIPYGLPQKTKA